MKLTSQMKQPRNRKSFNSPLEKESVPESRFSGVPSLESFVTAHTEDTQYTLA